MSLEKRIESESKTTRRIINDDLTCSNCKFKYDDIDIFKNTSICEQYSEGKPNQVLLGGDCDKKVLDND